jgi:hypothetical protein
MNLEGLPEIPLLEKIVEYCDVPAKLNLMLVNKKFYNFIGKNPRLCKFFQDIAKI